jgi:hypothetical protein
MLSPYLRSNVAAATYQPIGNYDTATVVKAYVTNAESVTITKGQVVYIFGASGDRASVKLAKNTSDTFSSKTLGIVREDIAAGESGWITTQGQVSGINLGAYTPGDILWLDSIPGGFTATKPQAPYHAVFLGVVERANVGNGLIYVKPQNGVELDELHDVRITSLANNDVIRYNSLLGYWENKSIETTSGVQWTGVDSTFAAASASNGVHVVDDFLAGSFGNGVTSYPSGLVPTGTISFALENTRYGIMTLGTTTSTTGTSRLSKTNLSDSLNSLFNVTSYMVKMPTLSDSTQTYHVRVGMTSQVNTANPNGGAYFVYSTAGTPTGSAASANWQCVTGNGSSVRTWTTTSTAVTTGWTKLTVVASSSICFFYVNDVLVATHTTNIPTPALTPNFEIRKTVGTTERLLWVDYFTQDVKYNTAR